MHTPVPGPEVTPPSEENPPRRREISFVAIGLGLLLSVVMGAANVYLGLKAGMTVAASIPAAVIAMGVLRGVMRRSSILEANLVQTAASAGESLSAGIVFTIPALVISGVWTDYEFWPTTLIALAGGLLGILLMIPMRKVFVVDDKELIYPEGVACAEVLKAGSPEAGAAYDPETAQGIFLIIGGMIVGAVAKVAGQFLLLMKSTVEWGTTAVIGGARRVFFFGADISPALVAVGYVVGLSIAVQIFVGGAIGWVLALPLLNGSTGTAEYLAANGHSPSAVELAEFMGKAQIRFIGVGAMIVGGLASLVKVRGSLVVAVREMVGNFRRIGEQGPVDPRHQNLSGRAILALSVVCVALIGGVYYHLLSHSGFSMAKTLGLTAVTTLIMLALAFFFTAVSSYIVGLVGNSNSPVSGMVITALMATALLMLAMQLEGDAAKLATLGVAGVVCCVACTAGDVCNDLKTGLLVGATPRKQQILQILGVCVAAFVMQPVVWVLNQGALESGGIGGSEYKAPQAGLFASLANGFFPTGDKSQGSIPKDMLAWGIGLGLGLLAIDYFILEKRKSKFRLHVMPVAVGIYLSLGLTIPILLGGFLHFLVSRRAGADQERQLKRGVLLASGVIAGESLIGVLLGVLAWRGYKDIPGHLWTYGNVFGTVSDLDEAGKPVENLTSSGEMARDVLSLVVLLGVAAWMYTKSRQKAK